MNKLFKLNIHSHHFLIVKLIIPTLFLLLPLSSFSEIREFQTTWSKSTAGAGVGSILMDEANSVNPAPLGFFQMGSVYLQKADASFTDGEGQELNKGGDTTAVIISDAKGALKGSISYYKYSERFDERKQYSVSIASPVLEKSAFGVTYKLTKDRLSENGSIYSETKTYQTLFGVMHAVSNNFTIGLVAKDPIKKKENDTKGILGFQYVYEDFISIMFDAGTNYYKPLEEEFLYRGAFQVKVFSDFFLRAGIFNDKGIKEKGTGIGIGWVGPRLVFNVALKNTEEMDTSEKIKETALSLSYKF
ncbi:MAG: hypothetical protein OEY33_00245 [Bdellovibrionales bacterium]|jgi:hypothetical protein|nr:hypothetical protein [Bdellovibrionales bacterium]